MRNKINQKSKYPFAIVGVNISLLLADILQIKDQAFESNPNAPYWTLFNDPLAFYELFVICFTMMDQQWTKRNAVRSDFGRLTTSIKVMVTKVLSQGPTNLHDFQLLADEIMAS